MSRKPLTDKEINEILKAVAEAYRKAGKEIKTGTLIQGDKETLVLDTRKKEEIN